MTEIPDHDLVSFQDIPDLPALMSRAAAIRDDAWGNVVTYSPKVFIPLTKLCRDVCHYCTFARPPIAGRRAFLRMDEVLELARTAAAAGCREALFTLATSPSCATRSPVRSWPPWGTRRLWSTWPPRLPR